MKDVTTGNHFIDLALGIGAIVGMVWAGLKVLLQPAFKIAQLTEQAETYKDTAEANQSTIDALKERIDILVQSNEALAQQLHAQATLVDELIQRSDMALLYIADRMAWERRGRAGAAPLLPDELETALYEVAARRKHKDAEVPDRDRPFSEAPEEGAAQ